MKTPFLVGYQLLIIILRGGEKMMHLSKEIMRLFVFPSLLVTALMTSSGQQWFLPRSHYHSSDGRRASVSLRARIVVQDRFFPNNLLLAGVTLTCILQLVVTYRFPLQSLFGTLSLPPFELTISLGLSFMVFMSVEIEKWFNRRAVTL
jgi:magnesium-transporting ATPase (P-type)